MTGIQLSATAAIPARYANRHGLVTGPTGTGKTITLMRLIESFAQSGVPVIAPDVKGDLSALTRSCETMHLQPLSGHGSPMRIPVWAFGADLLSRALELSDAQSGVLEIAFVHADKSGAPLDSLSDFRDLLAGIADDPASVASLGYVTRASVGTIQRALLRLEAQGAKDLFGAPGYDVATAMTPGVVSIVDVSRLYHAPRLYGALMLYLLRDLATRLPECGDLDKPRLCLVMDEAHCLFHEASPALLRSVEATARLIRSKGVGLYFASQSAQDIPQVVREQCATTIQHSREFGVGRARFTTLDQRGQQTTPVMIKPELPSCPLGPLDSHELPETEVREAMESADPPVMSDRTMRTIVFSFLGVVALGISGIAWVIGAGHGTLVIGSIIGLAIALR